MTVATVRMLIPDMVQYDRVVASGDGLAVDYKMPQSPIVTGTASVYLDGVLQAPAAYTLDLNLGLLTFVAAPGLGVVVLVTHQCVIFSDATLTAFLTVEGNVDKRATALALETMASNEAYVQKVIRILDLSTNGAQTADSLLKRAALLRAQAEDEVADAGFEIAEMVLDDFSYREFLEKDALRDG